MKTETRVMIENIVSLICWTIIAIVFKTWWLMFFSILFMGTLKRQHFRICDKCGKCSPMCDSSHAAVIKAQELGWIRRKVGNDWEDFCPDCQNK